MQKGTTMELKTTKTNWTKPEINRIDLVFDKEMSDNCKGSSKASAQHDPCGVEAGNQDACWNSQTGSLDAPYQGFSQPGYPPKDY